MENAAWSVSTPRPSWSLSRWIGKASGSSASILSTSHTSSGITGRSLEDADELHLHLLRHMFASWLALDGIPTMDIKDLMGHSSIAVTQIYTTADRAPAECRLAHRSQGLKKKVSPPLGGGELAVGHIRPRSAKEVYPSCVMMRWSWSGIP